MTGRHSQTIRSTLAGLGLALTLAMAATTLYPGPAEAQGRQSADDTSSLIQVLSVADSDETVVLDVAVPLADDGSAPSASMFGLTFNGAVVDDFRLSAVTTPVDVIVVIDTSGSMVPNGAMAEAKRAAATLLERLPDNAQVGVIGFGDTVTVFNRPTGNRETALANIRNLRPGGETALWDALVAAADLSRPSAAGPYVIVLTDGADSQSRATSQAAVSALDDADAAVFSVFIDSPEADDSELRAAVASLNGIHVAADGDELQARYEAVADRLSGRYRLSFTRPAAAAATVNVSVLVDDALAYAQVRLGARSQSRGQPSVSPDGSPADADPEGPARVLNVPAGAQLGAVATPDPGLLGGPAMLPIGVAAMFLAMVLMAVLVVNPAVDVRMEAAGRADQVAGFKDRLSSAADQLVARGDDRGELNRALDAAGLHLRPGEFVLIIAVLVVVLMLLGWLAAGPALGILAAIATVLASLTHLNRRAATRRERFADQLTDTLGVLSGSLRAGRGLPQALELVARESPSPTAEQFRRVVFEVQVGRDMTEAMEAVAERMKSQDFEWVASAVAINRELGGDLTELLDTIADTIRERRRIARMVRSISAEGRASGWVLLALPFFVFAFAMWRTPENANLMFTTGLGRFMLALSVVGMVVGYFWIRKIVNFEY